MSDPLTKKEERRKRTDGVRAPKMRRQRQAMISRAIELGSFRDRDEVKGWLRSEFRLDERVEDVSTEYSLTDGQLKLFYIWLRYFTGQGPKPNRHVSRAKAGTRRLWKISQLRDALGWSDTELVRFIERQIGRRKMPQSLYSNEASKVITGMTKILDELPFKRKHELTREK